MHPDVVHAQTASWRKQADEWAREAEFNPGRGYAEVAFLLRRAADQADAAVSGAPPPAEPEPMPDATEGRLRED